MAYVVIAADAPFGYYEAWLNAMGFDALWTLTPDGKQLRAADFVLFPGGGDVNPELYGEADTACRRVDDALDRSQIRLLREALALKVPVEGICRGLQLINVALGGSLIQHLETAVTHEAADGKDSRHSVTLLRGVAPLFERKAEYPAIAEVNSSHHQAAAKPFPGAIITATAPDGTIEGLAAPQLRLNAVQWHPERLQ